MQRDIVVIGASAGGVETLGQLVTQLPATLQAAIIVAMHFPAYSLSMLPSILSKRGPLPVKHPEDGESIKPGHIYISPPGQHVGIIENQIQLSQGPRENGFRPSIDKLFRVVH